MGCSISKYETSSAIQTINRIQSSIEPRGHKVPTQQCPFKPQLPSLDRVIIKPCPPHQFDCQPLPSLDQGQGLPIFQSRQLDGLEGEGEDTPLQNRSIKKTAYKISSKSTTYSNNKSLVSSNRTLGTLSGIRSSKNDLDSFNVQEAQKLSSDINCTLQTGNYTGVTSQVSPLKKYRVLDSISSLAQDKITAYSHSSSMLQGKKPRTSNNADDNTGDVPDIRKLQQDLKRLRVQEKIRAHKRYKSSFRAMRIQSRIPTGGSNSSIYDRSFEVRSRVSKRVIVKGGQKSLTPQFVLTKKTINLPKGAQTGTHRQKKATVNFSGFRKFRILACHRSRRKLGEERSMEDFKIKLDEDSEDSDDSVSGSSRKGSFTSWGRLPEELDR